jgi:hypothetical protein
LLDLLSRDVGTLFRSIVKSKLFFSLLLALLDHRISSPLKFGLALSNNIYNLVVFSSAFGLFRIQLSCTLHFFVKGFTLGFKDLGEAHSFVQIGSTWREHFSRVLIFKS